MITSTMRAVFCESKYAEALQILRALVGPVRSHPGCLATRLMQDEANQRLLTWVEQWREPEDHERHVRSQAFRRLLAVMDLAAEPPSFEVDVVSQRRGFDLVEELLGAQPLNPRNPVTEPGALPAEPPERKESNP